MLSAVEDGVGEKVETVVALEYKVEEKENGSEKNKERQNKTSEKIAL